MLNYKQLKQILKDLEGTTAWFFMCMDSHPCPKELMGWNFTDLFKLPKQYQQNVMSFFSSFYAKSAISESSICEKYACEMPRFIKEATGLELELFFKYVKNKKRIENLKKDFV